MPEVNSMNSCRNCIYADWDKTAKGRLHPNGHGQCKFDSTQTILPKAFGPVLAGGYISRKDPYENCPKFEEKRDDERSQ